MKLSQLRNLSRYERLIPVAEYLAARGTDFETERRFLSQLRLPNGVQKTSHERRLDDTAALLARQAQEQGRSTVRVLDVACSSGVSTLELHQILAEAGLEPDTVGTDLAVDGRHVCRGPDGILFDRGDRVIQIEWQGYVTPWFWRKRETLHHPYLQARTHFRAWRNEASFREALHGPSAAGHMIRTVPFWSSRIDSQRGVSIVQEDLLRPTIAGSFDIIRAANILNRIYFDEAALRRMLAALSSRLTDGGLLLVARTVGTTNYGSLFVRSEGGLVELAQLNGGSEIRDLAMRSS